MVRASIHAVCEEFPFFVADVLHVFERRAHVVAVCGMVACLRMLVGAVFNAAPPFRHPLSEEHVVNTPFYGRCCVVLKFVTCDGGAEWQGVIRRHCQTSTACAAENGPRG